MKDLRNIYPLLKDFRNSTLFFTVAFFGFTSGILVFFSKYFNPIIFIFLLFLPFFLFFSKENSIFFIILCFLFFLCLGVLRASFNMNTYDGLVGGKGYVSSFVKNSEYYKLATIDVKESTKDILSKVEGRFDLKEKVDLFDEIVFQGELKKPYRYKNIVSKTPIYENMLENRRILKVNELEVERKNKLFGWLMEVRQYLINQVEKSKWDGKSFFIEVLFGEKVLDDNMRDVFSQTGTAHILSISGLHFTLTVFFAYVVVYFFNFIFPSSIDFLPRQVMVTIISIPLLIIYGFLSGLSIPAMRSFLFFIFYSLFLLFFKKRFSSFNLLFLIALIFLIDDPYVIMSLSFQLSFLSVFALLISFKFNKFLNSKFEKSLKLKILHYFIAMMFVSLVVTLFVIPILNTFTRQNFFATMLANPVVIPLFSFIILPFLFISLPFSFVNENLFNTILIIPNFGWKIISGYLVYLSKILPEIYLDIDFSMSSLIIYYLTLLLVFLTPKKTKLIIVIIGILLVFILRETPLKGPVLVFPDVGQGDCGVIKTEEGKIIFIDVGGNTWDENLGKRVYLPLIRKLGTKKIDCVLLSHSHPDHSGMLSWLNKNYRIEKVIGGEGTLSLKSLYLIKNGDLKIYILPGFDDKKENNRSNWVLLEYKNYRMLFTGDTEKDGIEKMLRKYTQILKKDITLIKVPHHGANSSFYEGLYKELNPSYAIITVGKGNPWNIPSKEVIEYLRKKKIKYFRTDEDGEIIINLNDGKVITYKQYYGF